jgi:signal transduction histidine kinase
MMTTTEAMTTATTEARTTEATMTEHGRRVRRQLSSARARILLAIVVLLAFSTLLSVLAIRELLLVRTDDRVDAALTQEVGEFRALARGRNPRTGKLFRGDLPAIYETFFSRNVPARGETVIGFADGRQPISTSTTSGGRIAFGEQAERWQGLERSERGEFDSPSGVVRYLAVPVAGPDGDIGGTFVVTAALGPERDEVEDAVRLAAIVLLTVLLIASALAWVVAGRVLAPLRVLSDTARSIGQSDLTRRIPASGTDELAELGRTFNAMLDRLEAAFDSQRAFVSDASHELRTPITIVRGHLELLGDDPEERRETIALVTDELDRMSRFVDDLLLLARAERDDFLRVGEVELGALTDELAEKASALGPRRWTLESRAEAVLVADRQRLTQAMMGLAQNAVQHTNEGDTIELGSARNGSEARLWVRDGGPGIAPRDQERVFERFARASARARRSEGAGLGLSIVRAIAEAHGGRVELDSRPGHGATFTLVLPLDGGEEPAA